MKNLKIIKMIAIVICIVSFVKYKSQSFQEYKLLEWKNGSEAAKKIMVSQFYYDPSDAWSPFGNDTGSDTYYLYCDWKKTHSNENTKKFLDDELSSLGFPSFDISMDGKNPENLKKFVNDAMPHQYISLNAINNMIISLAFSQLFLEGRIEPEVKKWAEAAFSRESVYLDFWGDEKKERKERMNQMLNDLRKG